jgi:hypothetical protein
MMEEGRLYGSKELLAGKIAEHRPGEFISTRVAEGVIPFGRAMVRGTAGSQVKLPSSGSGSFVGISGFSFEAGNLDEEAYADKDPVACIENGVAMVYAEEAVGPEDPVRVRHSEDMRAGYQEWGFSVEKASGDASGLANNTTTSGAIITVDGVAKEISIVGSAAQTIATVISQLNADLGAAAIAALVSGKIRITSATIGEDSSVSITDGLEGTDADLFATLTDSNDDPEEAVEGSADIDPDIEPGNFRTSAIAGKTFLLTGAEFDESITAAGLVRLKLTGIYTVTADV